jgi:ubiquinone/menaquinone biosynthesis C-methylase UbiE
MTNNKVHVNEAVSLERWQTAQGWEEKHWIKDQKELKKFGKNYIWRIGALLGLLDRYRGDDRNRWWQDMFDGYRFLPSTVENALEIGCGPYTNMRLIRKICRPAHLYLSDPLIRTYTKFKMTFVSQMHKEGACTLDDHPGEELPFKDEYFDLVVMINVLDHVRDADACMKNLIRVTKPGGLVVLGQDLTSPEDLARQPDGLKIGHPITVDEQWFQQYFAQQFEPRINKVLPRDAGWAPQWHYGTLLYVGHKKL